MTLDYIILMLKETNLNTKTNNHIISGLNEKQIKEIIDMFSKTNSIITNYEDIKDEHIPNNNQIINIPIDLKKVEVNDIFNYIFNKLNISETLDFDNRLSVLKFIKYLFENEKIVRIIICNPSCGNSDDQKLLNELLFFTSYSYNVCYLLEDKNNIKTYSTTNGTMLDNRENYNPVKLVLK